MSKTFREKMAEMIVQNGDKLCRLEDFSGGAVVMWYIVDGKSYNNPLGRLPQYQVWKMDKRCYVGTDRHEAYADFAKQKDSFIADHALI